jgi:hypothetical protein
MNALYRVGYLTRIPLRTPYPAIVATVKQMLSRLPRWTPVAIDYTGIGRPVFDMFVEAGIAPVGLLITGGGTTTWEGRIAHVPKVTLISRLIALLHQGVLKVHRDLPEAQVLIKELRDYRGSYTEAGNLVFNARSGRHDDILLATAIAAWMLGDGGMPNSGVFEHLRQICEGDRERYCVGVDLGQSQDPTAIAVMSRVNWPSDADVNMPEFVPAAA